MLLLFVDVSVSGIVVGVVSGYKPASEVVLVSVSEVLPVSRVEVVSDVVK